MPAQGLRDLFVDELKDIYDAEQRLIEALPRMAEAAESSDLSFAFEEHLEQTHQHVARLERVFDRLGEDHERKTCKGMVGLINEGSELMEMDGEPGVRDAALIAAAQKIEHYELATYGCLRTWARLLDDDEAKRLLQETLDEEGAADHKLTAIAKSLQLNGAQDDIEKLLDDERASEMDAESPSFRQAGSTARHAPAKRK